MTDIERRGVSVIRGLAMDAPHAARSGHQGTAMALAPLAHVLWTRVLRYDAQDPSWPDRDRFVLSAGHASILLYSMLFLTGHGLELEDLREFRQWQSRTPGHPEAGHTPGVEVTTGPLGQGFANAVGMAIAERWLRSRFGAEVCDHRIYVIASDGCMSEGISHEAASLAGHQGLGRLICVYDDNRITIDGPTELALGDDPVRRFESYGWHVEALGESGEDLDALEAALVRAAAEEDRPSLLVLRSRVAYPSPDKTDDHAAHGYALFDEEIAATKRILGIPEHEGFWVPDEVLAWYRQSGRRGEPARLAWGQRAARLEPAASEEYRACLEGRPLATWREHLPTWKAGEQVATRVASGACIQSLVDHVPGLVGGGADLTSNTGTTIKGHGVMSTACPTGRQIFFGVREHAMVASMNGMALHGGLLPVGGTFLVFSDYARGALRLSALSQARVVCAFSHDSVGVGEDGPTHQPIEHLPSLRAMPGLRVIRPADANETAQAWALCMELDGPTALILSRQNVPVLDGTDVEGSVALGGYTLRPTEGPPDLILVGTGSEVAVCVEAAGLLADRDVAAAVVSLPCWSLFDEQPRAHRERVLAPGVPRLAVEAAAPFGWERYVDAVVGIDRFGASAPGSVVLDKLGINPTNVAERAMELLEGKATG